MLPNVGLRPVTPHVEAGETMLPQVSVPMANGTKPADVADAEPAEEPDEPFFKFHGKIRQ